MVETEAVLLNRFTRTGDAEAFAEIIRRHAGLVYGAALRILADVDRASDVAQETFLQLTKDAHNVTGSLPGWLHRVATHKAIDQMRRDASRRRREAEYMADKPHEVTDWKDLSRHVDEELNRLDSETRDMLVAHFLQGQTTRQIALSRGVSQATVSRRVDAGVTQLRATLRKRGILVAAGVSKHVAGQERGPGGPVSVDDGTGQDGHGGRARGRRSGGRFDHADGCRRCAGRREGQSRGCGRRGRDRRRHRRNLPACHTITFPPEHSRYEIGHVESTDTHGRLCAGLIAPDGPGSDQPVPPMRPRDGLS